MTLYRFMVARQSSTGCAESPELVPEVAQSSSESQIESLHTTSSDGPHDTPQLNESLTETNEALLVGLKYCIGGIAVDMIRINTYGERVAVQSVDIDGMSEPQDPMFFELRARTMWFKKCFGVHPSQTQVYQRLKKAVKGIFGKHRRYNWCVNKQGEPLSKTKVSDVRIGDYTLRVLPTRQSICIENLPGALNWLVNEVQANAREAGDEPIEDDDATADDPVKHAIQHPFDNDELELLENHNIKWLPSKRTLVYTAEGSTRMDSPCKKIKLNVTLKKRKRKGDDKMLACIEKMKTKALQAALDMATHGDADVDNLHDSQFSSPQGLQLSDEDTSDQSDASSES